MGIRRAYNDFLDSSTQLNDFDRVRRAAADVRRGHVPGLLGVLVASSVCSLFLSLLSSILGYGSTLGTLGWTVAASVVNMFVSQLAFSVFLLRVRGERMTQDAVLRFLWALPLLAVIVLVLSVAQTLLSNLVLIALSFNAQLAYFAAMCVSMVFTLVNAAISFCVLDGRRGLASWLAGSFKLLARNWAPLLGLSILFVAWMVFANNAYSALLTGFTAPEGIGNIIHALLNQHEFSLLWQVLAFYAINYVVGGLFEIAPLLGLAICYEQDGDTVYGER